MFIGVKVASDRALASFESDIRGLGAHADYEVLDISGIDFDERIYKRILGIEENSYPVLKTSAYIPAIRESIVINGIDTVKSMGKGRETAASPADIKIQDLTPFYRDLNAVLITKGLSDRYSIRKGDTLECLVYDKKHSLTVAGVLDSKNLPADAAIMDIGNFQEYFGRVGRLSAIDIAGDEETAAEIGRALPSNLSIEKKESLLRNRAALVASFRYNLQFVSLIAILVGIFLLYNTVFMSVVKRRSEIGVLRGLGADRRTVIMLFLVQGLVAGFAGSLLGIAAGQAAAYVSVIAVERTISTMYGTISITDYLITAKDAMMALVLGIAVSLVASAVPSFESSRVKPNESMREGSFESRFKGYRKLSVISGLGLILSGSGVSWLDYRYTPFEFPFLAYLGILLIILGFTFVSPFYLSVMLRALRKPAERMFGVTGKLAFGDMKGSLYRFSTALMSVAISSALIIALLTLIYSFRHSLTSWINRNITADLYIKPASCTSNFCFYPLSDEVASALEALPEVAGVDRFRTLSISLFGRKVVAGFGDIALQRKLARTGYGGSRTIERNRELESGRKVSISNYLGVKYGLKEGDTITLQTPRGKADFVVSDTYSSYSTTSGFIYMDRKWLNEYWGLDDATQLAVYLEKGADTGTAIRKLNRLLPAGYALEITNNRDLRKKVIAIFDKTFSITYAIELISIAVSLIGVVNMLLALVLERRREISVMRYLGGSWEQIRETFMISSGMVGIAGIALGTVMGLLMSIIFIQVINKISFGWEIQFGIPFHLIFLVWLFLLLTTLGAGLLPSRVARTIDPKKFISFE